jgi:hypothetical protein
MADFAQGGAKPSGRKLRLNVEARSGAEVAGKFLVCIDEEASIRALTSKIQAVLRKHGIDQGVVSKITNAHSANLPLEEGVGDVFRDGEEVVAMLGGSGGAQAAPMTLAAVAPPAPMRVQDALFNALDRNQDGAISRKEWASAFNNQAGVVDLRKDYCLAPQAYDELPAPAEMLEEDYKEGAAEEGGPQPGAWEVDGLTPKLREYISTRFADVRSSAPDPGQPQAYIMVTMRPQKPPALPIHYSIARMDVIEFERLCGRKVMEVRGRVTYFNRCREGLNAILDSGASRDEYAPNTLPYQYRLDGDFEDKLAEVVDGTFCQAESFRPVVVVDTSGAVGDCLPCVRAGLKRMLYSMMVAKSKFNFVGFSPQGRPISLENSMVPPTAKRLRRAEEWLDALRPVRGSVDIAGGLHQALAMPEADSVYFLSSGISRKANLAYILSDIRMRNVRDLPIHVVGVDCDDAGELALQRLAEQSTGSFRQKRFYGPDLDAVARSSRAPAPLTDAEESDDARLTIGGQLDIIDIMSNEHSIMEADWLEEQKCANRVLLSTSSTSAVFSSDDMRELKRQALADSERSLHASGSFPRSLCQRSGSLPPPLEASQRPASRGPPLAGSRPVVGSAGCGLRQLRGRDGSCNRAMVANPWDRTRPTRRSLRSGSAIRSAAAR